ncbi:hypothetical protein [Salinispora mooreana]|uniref:hypothetical protein n=1 Tax=Salinispora mooreana TaxID=999545 RepID=UPI000362DB49|nr:hypothetical protein [Salinispora mooreana]
MADPVLNPAEVIRRIGCGRGAYRYRDRFSRPERLIDHHTPELLRSWPPLKAAPDSRGKRGNRQFLALGKGHSYAHPYGGRLLISAETSGVVYRKKTTMARSS